MTLVEFLAVAKRLLEHSEEIIRAEGAADHAGGILPSSPGSSSASESANALWQQEMLKGFAVLVETMSPFLPEHLLSEMGP